MAENIARLRGRGVEIIDSADGQLANLETGRGRLPDAQTIYDRCLQLVRV
ncbi:MAG: hypothetical protein MUF02_06815 [Acidobacteria bacterium]|nr:hypothetical protein [Acidobacteriota bacterium]